MKANAFLTAAVAGALALAAAQQAGAQREETRRDAPAAVRMEVPAGGLTLNFADIDRNKDGSISVEEWNAFIAALPARAKSGEADRASAGASSPAANKQEQPKR
jgi:EF hand domain-containing protein